MSGLYLIATVFLNLLGCSAAFRRWSWNCPAMASIVEPMTEDIEDQESQRLGCKRLAGCINPESKANLREAAAAGALEAMMAAMGRWPHDKELMDRCLGALGKSVLSHRENALHVGRLGGINLTLAAVKHLIAEPDITSHAGIIGSLLDNVDQDGAIVRELNGTKLLIESVENNFHGRFGEWNQGPVKGALVALASACWRNSALCRKEGYVKLAIRIIREHSTDGEVVTAALRGLKAMMVQSEDSRNEASWNQLAQALIKVMKKDSSDRAFSSVCETVSFLVGPKTAVGVGGEHKEILFSKRIQDMAVLEELVPELLLLAKSKIGKEPQILSEGAAEDRKTVNTECLDALYSMSYNNTENVEAMLEGGMREIALASLGSADTRKRACTLLHSLKFSRPSLYLWRDDQALNSCGWY